MNKLIITTIAILFLTTSSLANGQPDYLKDSTIQVTLKNGKKYSFDGNEYMVVKRGAKKDSLPENHDIIVALHRKVVELNKHQQKSNRVRLIGGYGPSGFESSSTPSSVKFSTTNVLLGGIGYDRMLNRSLSLGAQVLSNGTYTLGLGLDF